VFFVGFLVDWEFYHQQHISFLGCEKETPKSWQSGMFYWKFLSISRSEVPNSSVIPQTNTGWLIMLLINVNHITIIHIYIYTWLMMSIVDDKMEFIWDQSILPFVCQPAGNSDITHLVPF
jgi:hypothetical protein